MKSLVRNFISAMTLALLSLVGGAKADVERALLFSGSDSRVFSGSDSRVFSGSDSRVFSGSDSRVASVSLNRKHQVIFDLIDDPGSQVLSVRKFRRLQTFGLEQLEGSRAELERIFGKSLTESLSLRFVSPQQFREKIGEVDWSGGVFLNGEVLVRISLTDHLSERAIRRTLRHEYAHVAIAELTNQRCPAWIEEGWAQLFEGPLNPALTPALLQQLLEQPIALADLRHGFATLPKQFITAAYAQSLFAVRTLSNRRGISGFKRYFQALRSGVEPSEAFEFGFGLSEHSFELELQQQLGRWKRSGSDKI